MKIPSITEQDIINWLGAKELKKGTPYAKDKAVRYMRAQEMTLKAECWGSSPNPYQISITFNKDGPETGYCSCPVGSGAKCKHAAALLYNWAHFPENFQSIEPLEKVLNNSSKEELISLIEQMLDKHPDLELLLEVDEASNEPLTPAMVERQVQKMLDNLDYEWKSYGFYDSYDDYEVFQPFRRLLKKAEGNLRQGNSNDAGITFQTLAGKLMENYEQYNDEEGSLDEIIGDCVTGLGQCLSVTKDSERLNYLKTMFDIYSWDIELGGYGIGDEVPEIIGTNASEDEKSLVATWLNEAIRKNKGDSWSKVFHKQTYGKFLLELSSGADDESYLQMCRQTGRHFDATKRLLKLKQIDDAVKETKLLSSRELIEIANYFIEQGYTEQIYELILERSLSSEKGESLEWLCDYHQKRNEYSQALKFKEQIFWRQTYLDSYLETEVLAKKTNDWLATKERLLADLYKRGKYKLLTEIYLHDKNIAEAIKTLEQALKTPHSNKGLIIKVARAAEKTHPNEALNYYMQVANEIIKLRARNDYAKAVSYLTRIQKLYEQLGQETAWQKYLLAIKQETKQMRAFKAELQKAKL